MENVKDKFSEIIGVECDNVLSEYVMVMVENGKTLASMKEQLIEVTGEDPAQKFCEW
jgi:hypothetical protein